MKLRYCFNILLCICLYCLNIVGGAAQTVANASDRLYTPDIIAWRSNTTYLPVSMDNTHDVTAVQFNIGIPREMEVAQQDAFRLTNRASDHVVQARRTKTDDTMNWYLVMIYSPTNAPIVGRTGKILEIKFTMSDNAEEGAQLSSSIINGVMSTPDKKNVCGGVNNGTVSIEYGPDLIAPSVTLSDQSIAPDGTLNVSWTVQNIGDETVEVGWSEEISIVEKDATAENYSNYITRYIGTVRYDQPLEGHASVSRNATLQLPSLLGIDGDCRVMVKIVPYPESNERPESRSNNITVSNQTLYVNKALTFTLSQTSVIEKRTQRVTGTINRSGRWDKEETFNIEVSGDSRVSAPASVTIAKGQSAARFDIIIANNDLLDPVGLVTTIKVSDTSATTPYASVSGMLSVEDDEIPTLSLTANDDEVEEGGTLGFTLSVDRAPSADLPIKFTSDFARRLNLPSDVFIAAGKKSVDFTIQTIDNEEPDIEQVVTLYASATDHNTGEVLFALVDNDTPNLELQITPDAVSESVGPLALTAKLHRLDKLDKVVTIKFFDDSNGNIYYGNQTVKLEKGDEYATIKLGPIDNALVEGERTYNVSAAVYIASCSCNASIGSKGGIVSVPITVYDNDGPTLTLQSATSVLKEGGEAVLTVTRNTNTAKPLTVNISCNKEGIEVPAQVTIPAGNASVSFTIRSIASDLDNYSYIATITAEANNYSKSNVWLTVSDMNVPDAQVADISISESEVVVGGKVDVTITVTNTGAYPLPEQTKTNIYISGQSVEVASSYLQSPLAPGDSVSATKSIVLPSNIGTFDIYAVTNADNYANELSTTNNTSNTVRVKTVSPFTVKVTTDKSLYMQDEKVKISGSVVGDAAANQSIEVYIINDGYRQVLEAVVDENGKFAATYEPIASQMGHFEVGACYPGEGLKEALASFDINGIRRVDNSYIKIYPIVGQTYSGTFAIVNPGKYQITGICASVNSKPDNCVATVSCPTSIAAGGTAVVTYTLTSADASVGNEWERAVLDITSAEHASLQTTLYYYTKYPEGHLKSSISSIDATMQKGKTREYPITITNDGNGETGKIKLALPSWMKSSTPVEMSSLAPGESAEIVLLFTPTDDMQLNVPVTGGIGINCERGNGVSISYIVEPVSQENGTLLIDVCDEYTYYTNEAPHVSGAKVKISHPYTGAEIASGETDENGHYTINIPEGYYRVMITADKHETYNNYVCINASRTENVVVNLSYQPITISWDVVETEVEDEYHIVSTTKYETNVPTPVVKISLPERIDGDNMAVGDFTIIYMTLTNVGLIRADNVDIVVPTDEEFLFEPLDYNNLISLAPQQSVVVPVRVTRIADSSSNEVRSRKANNNSMQARVLTNCVTYFCISYEYLCGQSIKTNRAAESMALKFCSYSYTLYSLATGLVDIYDYFFDGDKSGKECVGNPGSGSGNGGGGGLGYTNPNGPYKVNNSFGICDPDKAERVKKLIDLGIGNTWLGMVDGLLTNAIDTSPDSKYPSLKYFGKLVLDEVLEFGENIAVDKAADKMFADETHSLFKENTKSVDTVKDGLNAALSTGIGSIFSKGRQHRAKSQQDEAYDAVAIKFLEYIDILDNIMLLSFGDRAWYEDLDEEKFQFLTYVDSLEDGYIPSDDEIRDHKPESVSFEKAKSFIYHLNGIEDDMPSIEDLYDELEKYTAMTNTAVEDGYESMYDKFDNVHTTYVKYLEEMASSSVCASISLQFSQTMTMTRQAFRGTLTVFNGHETTAMQNVRLNLEVKNLLTGQVATSREFQINPENLSGFEGNLDLTSGWSLEANTTGSANIIFIPTKNAAPTIAQEYSFGGTLVYTDPFTGLEVTRDLFPINMTVKPSPILDLTYFMQRDVIGDDPLTEAIEPCEEAEFSVLIKNKGYGDATNVKMVTEQPQIVDNQKDLLIDFELMSSKLKGEEKTLALGDCVATDFGTIPAMSSTYAQWLFKSSLLGHFVDYDIEASHVTSYGNEDLSLLDQVTIHELIRSINNEGQIAFLVNDIQDEKDTPDMLYLADGDIKDVYSATAVSASKKSNTTYEISFTPSAQGWNYGNVVDPTYGVAELKSVVRKSDGKEISLRNIWQTDRTLRDGCDPLYENRIHLIDNLSSVQAETYILTFEPAPNVWLEVSSFSGAPKDGVFVLEPVPYVDVTFNKSVDPETFTVDDLSLTVQGEKQDISLVGITTEDNRTFHLDFTTVNETLPNGYYNLGVQTSEITDYENYQGKTGKNTSWVMFREGQIMLTKDVYPALSGTISYSNVSVNEEDADESTEARRRTSKNGENAGYGSTLRFEATPEEGYQFINWTLNGTVVSNQPVFEYTALNDIKLVANFAKKKYRVVVEDCVNGDIPNAQGYYEHGEEVTFTAQPSYLYALDYWIVNGENAGNNAEVNLVIDKPYTISALFYRDLYEQYMTLNKGWNWVSSYLAEPIPVANFNRYTSRIVGQFDEAVDDPEFGMAGGLDAVHMYDGYKIEASNNTQMVFTGHILPVQQSTVPLNKAWNWIGYPWDTKNSLSAAIGNAEEGDFIVSQTGFAEYADGYWEGSVESLIPGQGYMYRSVSSKNLVLEPSPSTTVPEVRKARAHKVSANDVVDIHTYPNTMNITARLYEADEPLPADEYIIYAMSGSECRGLSQNVGSNCYLTVYGDTPVDISFIVENINTGESHIANETILFCNDIVGSRKNPYKITIGESTRIRNLDYGSSLSIYSVEGILLRSNASRKDLERLNKGVYIINGQKYYVK